VETGINLSYAALVCGALGEGAAIAQELLTQNLHGFARMMISANLASIRSEQLELELATTAAKTVLSGDAESAPWPRMVARSVVASVRVARGDLDGAKRDYIEILREYTHCGRQHEKAYIYASLAEIALCQREMKRAALWATDAEKHLGASDEYIAVGVNRVIGAVRASQGLEGGIDQVKRALSSARRTGMKLEEGRCLLALGSILTDGAPYFELAEASFSECGCKRGLQELDEARARMRATV
jgi:ATP/maltotriose-dependent transcriptional regulator MalT